MKTHATPALGFPRRFLIAGCAVLALCCLLLASTWRPPIVPIRPPSRTDVDRAAIDRGTRLATIGNCIGCHTSRDGAPFAGGRGIGTPFGTIYSSNITPDPDDGIGTWSLAAFTRAMRQGVARDGHHLYPAFPYDHFRRLADADLGDLYGYLMSRTPVAGRPPPNDLRFPFGFRPLLAGWKLLSLDDQPFRADPGRDAAWNRGAYLADALAHCSACHAPRSAIGAERRDSPFAGGYAEGWYAPPLDASTPSPQLWTVASLAMYLRSGIAPDHAIAGGPMAGVTQQLGLASESDVEAIAAYIVAGMGEPSEARRERAAASRLRASEPTAAPTAAPASSANPQQLALGATVYGQACATCHEPGRGPTSNSALRLPLAVALYDDDPRSFLHIVRDGIRPVDGTSGRVMPAFGTMLSEEQIVALAAWLRSSAADAPPWNDLAAAARETAAPPKEGSP